MSCARYLEFVQFNSLEHLKLYKPSLKNNNPLDQIATLSKAAVIAQEEEEEEEDAAPVAEERLTGTVKKYMNRSGYARW